MTVIRCVRSFTKEEQGTVSRHRPRSSGTGTRYTRHKSPWWLGRLPEGLLRRLYHRRRPRARDDETRDERRLLQLQSQMVMTAPRPPPIGPSSKIVRPVKQACTVEAGPYTLPGRSASKISSSTKTATICNDTRFDAADKLGAASNGLRFRSPGLLRSPWKKLPYTSKRFYLLPR